MDSVWIQCGAAAQLHHGGGGSTGSRSRADIALSRTVQGAQGPASTSWDSCQQEENDPTAPALPPAGARVLPHGHSSIAGARDGFITPPVSSHPNTLEETWLCFDIGCKSALELHL